MYKDTYMGLKKTKNRQAGRFFGKDLTNLDDAHLGKAARNKGATKLNIIAKKGRPGISGLGLPKSRSQYDLADQSDTPTFRDKENIDTKGQKKLKPPNKVLQLNKSRRGILPKNRAKPQARVRLGNLRSRDNSTRFISRRSKSRGGRGGKKAGIKGALLPTNGASKQRSLSRPPLDHKDKKSDLKKTPEEIKFVENGNKSILRVGQKKLQLQSKKSQKYLLKASQRLAAPSQSPLQQLRRGGEGVKSSEAVGCIHPAAANPGAFGRSSCNDFRFTAPVKGGEIGVVEAGFDFESFPELNHSQIWNLLITQREKNICKTDYFKDKQKDINQSMRAILVDWLIDVHKKFKLRPQTLFMCCSLIDRILEIVSVAKHRFQLLGITALFIASKYEEIYPPTLSDFSFVCADAYKEKDILVMEANILKALDFNLVYTSPFCLLESYSFEKKFNQKAKCLLLYIQHLILLSYEMVKYDATEKVAASVYLVEKIQGNDFELVTNLLKDFNLPDKAKVKECAKELALLMSKQQNSRLTACKRKFKSEDYLCVSRIKVSVKDDSGSAGGTGIDSGEGKSPGVDGQAPIPSMRIQAINAQN